MSDRERLHLIQNIQRAVSEAINGIINVSVEAANEIVELLKEQEWQTKRLTPTEPNVSINAYGVKFYYCPHCKRPILKSGIIGRPRHCEDCGQAVKWDE